MRKIGKRILSLICALAMILPMLALPDIPVQAVAAGDGLDLATMQIVLPVASTDVEETAAQELKDYLYKIAGVTLSVVQEGQNTGAGIYIGATNYAGDNGVTYPTAGDENGEAWAIEAVDGNLVLCGAETRGALYAVYHLLEDVLGVHWWNLWEEEVPTGNAIVPADYADSGVPAMEYREIFIGKRSTADIAFYARNRMNGSVIYAPTGYGGVEYYGLPAHTHTFSLYFPAEYTVTDAWRDYIAEGGDFSTNPEWYSMDASGNRVSDAQLCLTNEGLIAEFGRRLVKSIEYCYNEADYYGNKRPVCFAVVPNDNTNFCQCSSCQSAISTYGLSGYVLRFVNEMAAAVTAAGFTDAILEMAAYAVYRDPPVDVVPAQNVQIRFADSGRDLLHGLDHENNADTLARLQAWADICSNNLYNWQYVVNYNNNGILPTMFHYGDDFATMMEAGVNGWFAEQEQCINADFWDMKQWLIAKLMEEPVTGEKYAALMDEFIYGYYGDAAGKYIREYLYYMHKKAEATNAHQQFGTHIIGAEWLSVQDIITGNGYFEKAFAAAGDDAVLLRRLRSARSGLDRVIIENYVKWEEQAAAAGVQLPFTKREVGERLDQTFTEQIALRGDYDADAPAFAARYDGYAEGTSALPDELAGVAREHILEYTTDDYRIAGDYNTVVEDADSLVGKAYCSNTSGITNATMLTGMKASVDIYAYDPGNTSSQIGRLTPATLKVNQGYQLYEFDWTVPELSDNAFLYMFCDWGLQIDVMAKDMQQFAGQTVKVYLSMKVTGTLKTSWNGNISFSDNPVYYVDRIFVLPYPDQPTHSYTLSASVYGDYCRSVCSACGDVVQTPHTWDAGVIVTYPTKEAEGQKLYTCSVCGGTKTEVLEKLQKHDTCLYHSYVYNGDATDSSVGTLTGACAYGCEETGTVAASSEHVTMFKVSDSFTLHLASLFGDEMVADTESVVGSTVAYAAYPRRNETTEYLINRPVEICATGTDGGVIGTIPLADLKPNEGYQLYKVSYDSFSIPSDAGMVYIFNDWGLQSTQLCEKLKEYNGKAIDLYLSLKITGDITGASLSDDSEENWPVYYLDRVIIVEPCTFGEYTADNNATCITDGTQSRSCNVCGLTEYVVDEGTASANHTWDAGVVTVEPTTEADGEKLFTCIHCGSTKTETLDKLPEADDPADSVHVHAYTADSFTVHEEDASEGIAEDAAAAGGKAFYRSGLNLTGDQKISIVRFDSGAAAGYDALTIGTLDASVVQMNQGYQLYKFSVTVPAEGLSQGNFVYFLADWQVQNPALANGLKDYAGQIVDIYLSMKVEGESAASATCYIDRVLLVERCESYAETTLEGTYRTTSCTKCGKTLKTEKVLPSEELIIASFTTDNFSLPYGDPVEADADSEVGKAAVFSYARRVTTGDSGLMNAMIFGDGKNMKIQVISGVSKQIAEIPIEQLRANAATEGYVLYKFADVELIEEAVDNNFIYIFDCWGFQVSLNSYKDVLQGKTVDIYLSMKITGNVSSDPTYYIDKVVIANPVPVHQECVFSNYVYNGDATEGSAGTLTGTCVYGCGATKTIHADWDHVTMFKVSDTFNMMYAGDEMVYDAESQVNSAAEYAAANGKYSHLVNKNVEFCTNADGVLGTVPMSELKTNAGYQLYKISLTNLNVTGSFVYLFGDWGLQSGALAAKLKEYNGTNVDVYLSLKINGSLTAAQSDTENLPVYYLDRIMLVEPCSFGEYTSDNNATCVADGTLGRACSACGLEEHIIDAGTATGVHTWDEGVVIKEATDEEQGQRLHTCIDCMVTKIEFFDKYTSPVGSWNLVLGGDIGMNFYLALSANDIAEATVDVTVGDVTDPVIVAELPTDAAGTPILTVRLAAAQMTEAVTLTLHAGSREISASYTVREYADVILAGDYTDATKALVKEMLNYGAASQTYFGHNSGSLANSGIDITPAAVPAEGSTMSVTGSVEGLKFYGATLLHKNKLAVRFYFTGSIDGVDFGEYEPVLKDGMYYIEIADICPQDLDEAITVTASYGTGELCVSYAPMDYIVRMYGKANVSDATKALVQALYGYHLAAEACVA